MVKNKKILTAYVYKQHAIKEKKYWESKGYRGITIRKIRQPMLGNTKKEKFTMYRLYYTHKIKR